jgi:hypothetical protein
MSGSQDFYGDDAEIEAIVRGFESCAMPDSEFSHRAHMVVALSYLYLSQLSVRQAAERMRAGLYRFLDHYGNDRQKYHETITLFWIKLVRGFMNRAGTRGRHLAGLASDLAATHPDSRLIYAYYSKELLSSDEARTSWVEPDLKPLDF